MHHCILRLYPFVSPACRGRKRTISALDYLLASPLLVIHAAELDSPFYIAAGLQGGLSRVSLFGRYVGQTAVLVVAKLAGLHWG